LKYIEQEISIQSSLCHQNIIGLYAKITEGPVIHLILEYASNGSLFEYMHKHRNLSDQQISFVFRELCESISYIHSFQILHRDIKLENILFDSEYHMKLADFGFACMINSPEKRTTVCGTREYFAPEIYTNKKQGLKLDIWCLGIILYELCHNRTPFNLNQKDFKEADQELKSLKYRYN
jgi:serine/threonine protein kinase